MEWWLSDVVIRKKRLNPELNLLNGLEPAMRFELTTC